MNNSVIDNLNGFLPISLELGREHPAVHWRKSNGTEIVTNLDRFYPSKIGEEDGSGALRVDWADVLGQPVHDTFYDHHIHKAGESITVGKQLQTSWDDAVRVSESCPPALFSGMTFHAARSGSTLVHRMLNHIASNISFCEPAVVNSLLNSQSDWNGAERASAVRVLLRILARSKPLQSVPRAFVKFNDIMAIDIDRLRTTLPDVPCLFIYRDPLEILVSISRTRTGIVDNLNNNRVSWAKHLQIPEIASDHMPLDEAAARIVGQIFKSVADSAEMHGNRAPLLVIDYHTLPDAFSDKVVPFFGLSLSAQDVSNLAIQTRQYSKADEEKAFEPDHEEKQRAATPTMKRLINQFVAPAAERCRRLCA